MQTYDFTRRRWDYDSSESPSKNQVDIAMKQMSAYINPSFDNLDDYIAGARTSGTVFTPTVSEAWTVDALIGKYLVALDADTSHVVYTISRIADNTATTVTIGTTWGDSALVANADTVIIYNNLEEVFESVNWEKIA